MNSPSKMFANNYICVYFKQLIKYIFAVKGV